MYCRYCGAENNDESTYCQKCGKPLRESEERQKNKGKIFSAFLLNIFAIVIPTFLIFAINTIPQSNTDSGGVSVEFKANYSGTMLLATMSVGIIIFIIGLVIFFLKNIKSRKILSIIYLILAVVDLCLLVGNTLLYVVASCGLGTVLYIPGILQIIAGTKYVSATK